MSQNVDFGNNAFDRLFHLVTGNTYRKWYTYMEKRRVHDLFAVRGVLNLEENGEYYALFAVNEGL